MTHTHPELQQSLAASLRTKAGRAPVVFTEIALGGSFSDRGRLDVVSFTSAVNYTRLLLQGFEVKASVADLKGDLRRDKWRQYLPWLHRLYFAFPDGLVPSESLPPEVGVVVLTKAGGWRYVRTAPKLPGEKVGTDTLARLVWRLDEDRRAAQHETRVVKADRDTVLARLACAQDGHADQPHGFGARVICRRCGQMANEAGGVRISLPVVESASGPETARPNQD